MGRVVSSTIRSKWRFTPRPRAPEASLRRVPVRPPARWPRLLATVLLLLLEGCGTGSGAPANAPIEPRAGLDPGRGCDSQLVVAKVNGLFAALNGADIDAAEKMFPDSASWTFHGTDSTDVVESTGKGIRIQPVASARSELLLAVNSHDVPAVLHLFPAAGGWEFHLVPSDAVMRAGVLSTSDVDQMDRQRLRAALTLLGRFHLTFTTAPAGRGSKLDHVSPEGTVWVHEAGTTGLAWQATGPPLVALGKHTLRGTGNIRLYCETGLFSWVGLGPSSVD